MPKNEKGQIEILLITSFLLLSVTHVGTVSHPPYFLSFYLFCLVYSAVAAILAFLIALFFSTVVPPFSLAAFCLSLLMLISPLTAAAAFAMITSAFFDQSPLSFFSGFSCLLIINFYMLSRAIKSRAQKSGKMEPPPVLIQK